MNGSLRVFWSGLTVGLGLALLAPSGAGRAQAQTTDTLAQVQEASLGALRAQIESRYQVQPVRDGILLLPTYGNPQVQTIELSDGEIAINGISVTGAELREKVAEDADAILRLSYLDADDRRILFGIGGAPIPSDTTAVAAVDTAAGVEEEEDADHSSESMDDRVRVGGSIHVRSDEVVDGDVVAVFGSARIDGTVTGDVVSVMGSVRLGPEAVVEGDLVAVAGSIDRASGSRVEGSIEEVGWGGSDVRVHGPDFQSPFLEGIGGLMMTVVWVIVLGALVALMYLLARRPVERMAYRLAKSPWKAALVGLVATILFIPVLILTIILLTISIIGIPLLLVIPFALVALAIGMLAGFTAVARHLGSAAEARFGWQHENPYIAVLIGVGLIMLVSFFASALGVAGGPLGVFAVILGIVGFVIQFAAWMVAFGALLLTRFGTRFSWGEAPGPESPASPPPAPGELDFPTQPPGDAPLEGAVR